MATGALLERARSTSISSSLQLNVFLLNLKVEGRAMRMMATLE
jgi:hypothetical protein